MNSPIVRIGYGGNDRVTENESFVGGRYSATLDSSTMTASVQRVRDIRRGGGSSDPRYLCAFGGRVYFAADDGEHQRPTAVSEFFVGV